MKNGFALFVGVLGVLVGIAVTGRRGVVVEWGTTTAVAAAPIPIAGMAIGVAAGAGGKVGKAGTPPSGAEGWIGIGLWVGKGGV